MALIKYGGGVASMQGKQGGSVHARNRAGAYIRNWAKPTNAPSDSQTIQRTTFATQSTGWSSLTESERNDWNNWANGLTLLNRMGDEYVPTGRQMYMSCNNNLALIGQPVISSPPIGEMPPTINPDMSLVLNETSDILTSLILLDGDVDADVYWLIFGAPYQIAGKRNLTTTFRVIAAEASASDLHLETEYIAIFGDTFPDEAYSQVKLRSISATTGLSSPSLIIESNATPPPTDTATVADAGTTSVNGEYTARGAHGGKPFYNLIGEPDNFTQFSIYWDGIWIIVGDSDSVYFSSDDTSFPWEATTWELGDLGINPVPTVTGP